MTPPIILPGSTIGVLGSGQLGRMFAIAARRMGYRVHTFSPDQDTPTGQVADLEIIASYDDLDAVATFAGNVSVVTFEFENVSTAAAEIAARHVPVRPAGRVLHISQHRLREKNWLRQHAFPTASFAEIHSLQELQQTLGQIGAPAILKTAGFGYDGKGQFRIQSPADAPTAWNALFPAIATQPPNAGPTTAILEAFVDFELELSVVAARGLDGAFTHWGALHNTHKHGILDVTTAPAEIPGQIAADAVSLARAILESLDLVGVLCVEMFLTRSGQILVNELAPRPHNSGHFSFDACVTSQFEQQLRAVCGLPLGDTALLRPAAMANLLGDLWQAGQPDFPAALAHPDVKLHLYGKQKPSPGRKMGHLTAMAPTPAEARQLVLAARDALVRGRAAT